MKTIYNYISIALFFVGITVTAQIETTIIKEGNYEVTESVTLKATQSITLKPNTWIKSGSTFLAIVNKDAYVPVDLNTDENYVFTRIFQSPITEGVLKRTGIQNNKDVIENITYFDGLGRGKQQIGIRQSPDKKDILTHIAYDDFGRKVWDYLPIPISGTAGSYRTGNMHTATQNYYYTQYSEDFVSWPSFAVNAASTRVYERSPLNRVVGIMAPGKDWVTHRINFDWQTNTATEVVRFDVNFTDGNIQSPGLVKNGNYVSEQLHVTVTKDENWVSGDDHTTKEYKDKLGRVVLKRTYNEGAHDTYYVYDDFGNLTFVIPPKVIVSDDVSPTELSELCYQYKYDRRNRLIEKKIPGKGWEYIVYDKLDRPVLTQDANQRTINNERLIKEWLFTKYDALDRVVYTGVFKDDRNRTALQSEFDAKSNASDNYEERASFGTGFEDSDYTNNDFPNTNIELLTINYYDTYNRIWPGNTLTVNSFGVTSTSRTKGLIIGTKVKVLTTNDWINTFTFYDEKARPIYISSNNEYLNTVDIYKTKLDFTGRVLETESSHTKGSNPTIVTRDVYTYDHVGRLLTQTQQINDQTAELIASNTYDPLGQLVSKAVGNTKVNPLQEIDYKYNIRGWLKQINDPSAALGDDLFAFKINYNTTDIAGATPLFNGNISETHWKTANDNTLRNYRYEYDALSRITSGVSSTTNYDLTSVGYDKNGNISNLSRNGATDANATSFGPIDVLSYSYDTGNKLKNVLDYSAISEGFKDGSITNIDDYSYDANGNLISDYNKLINEFEYNHLNLPVSFCKAYGINNSKGIFKYIYDALGNKLEKEVTASSSVNTTQYAGNYVYEDNALKFFNHPEGYVEPIDESDSSKGFNYVYQYKDHLGNIRLSYQDQNGDGKVAKSEIREEKNYYPFGMLHKSATGNVVRGRKHNYGFNGKENSEELGLNWHDFGVRNYDTALGRWMNIDPMAEVMYDQSPYNYAFNSPLMFIDPDGALPWPIHIRSFISASSVGGGLFGGDDRGASTQSSRQGARSRVSSSFTVDPAKGTSTASVSTSDLTIFYGAGTPGTGAYIPPMAERPDPSSSISNVEASDSSISLDFKHSAKDPITPSLVTPDLDVQASLNITEDLDNGILNVTGNFTGDAFPSTEAFITDQSGKTNLLLGAHKEVGGIGKLFLENKRPTFSVNMQVNIDSKGNFTGVTQGDKTYNVQEWNQHVQDTFNK